MPLDSPYMEPKRPGIRARIRGLVVAFALVVATGVSATPAFVAGFVYSSRRLLAGCAYLWSWLILGAAGVKLRIEGEDQLAAGRDYFFVGNHQSALDIPILFIARGGDVRFMAKASLFRIPLFGWVLRRYGFIPINRSNARAAKQRVDQMLQQLREHPISFVVFPEGTRSIDGRLLPFRMGALKICQRAGLDVVPFSVEGSLAVHRRGRWAIFPGPVGLRFAPPIPAGRVADMPTSELHDQVRSAIEAGRQSLMGTTEVSEATVQPSTEEL